MATGPSVLQDASWQEKALVSVTPKGGTEVQFEANLSEIGWTGGAKDVEGTPLLNGGRMRERSAQEDFEFTGTLYITGVSTAEGTGIGEWFHGSSDQSTKSTVYEFKTSHARDDFRIAVLFTNDSNVTSASGSVGADSSVQAYRWIMEDAQLTEYEPNFDDKVLEVEVTFVASPFDDSANSNVREQEYTGDSSEKLDALSSY
ncbi:MAG: hypothetical protein SVV03_02410 [Candidatus Nanohaloarchaea archaeon]|nr:hypothetical protein [Candidatus Nanohaloarchaea archaeon]